MGDGLEWYGNGTTTNKQHRVVLFTTVPKKDAYSVGDHI